MNLWVWFRNMNLWWIAHYFEFRLMMLTWNCVNLIGTIGYEIGIIQYWQHVIGLHGLVKFICDLKSKPRGWIRLYVWTCECWDIYCENIDYMKLGYNWILEIGIFGYE